MKLNASAILFIVAVVLFLVEAIGIKVGSLNVLALGLAAFAGGMLLHQWKM